MNQESQDTNRRSLVLDGDSLSIQDVIDTMENRTLITLSGQAKERIRASRQAVEEIVAHHTVTYGIQTGFGKLCNVRIDDEELGQLQTNLIRSHASGYGEPLPAPIVRGMMLIRANTLAKGHSGVSLELVTHLLTLLNKDILPMVPRYGSLGASGDLAPLAHMALLLIGGGEAWVDGELVEGCQALKAAGLQPLQLAAKEGLALINGTPLMAALGCWALNQGLCLLTRATAVAAMSSDALLGTDACFSEEVIGLRPHPGIMKVARELRAYLHESPIRQSHFCCPRVQDPYSMRCTPQVLGAALDVLEKAGTVFKIEINSATDNPLILRKEDGTATAVSGGNFHGEPLAFQLDFMAIALAELGSISERRINLLLDNEVDFLPEFLIEHNGLNSGFMLAHYTAAALVSRNRTLANPSSTDSLPTSANQEDHVSMGANAGIKLLELVDNLQGVLAIELLCAAQALDFHEKETGLRLLRMKQELRKRVPFIRQDVEIYRLIQEARVFLEEYQDPDQESWCN